MYTHDSTASSWKLAMTCGAENKRQRKYCHSGLRDGRSPDNSFHFFPPIFARVVIIPVSINFSITIESSYNARVDNKANCVKNDRYIIIIYLSYIIILVLRTYTRKYVML